MRIKTLAEQIGNKCTHFSGIREENGRCKAGVCYASVKDDSRQGFGRWPCWKEGEGVPCEKRHFPTPEEVAAEVAEHEEHTNRFVLCLGAASQDAKAHGFRKGSGGKGSVPCPACKTGELHYSVAGYNGHMHGCCTTKDCVSWMQ